MHSLVAAQGRVLAIALATLWAAVGPLVAVGALVPQEVGAVAKGLPTMWALVGLLARVGTLVSK